MINSKAQSKNQLQFPDKTAFDNGNLKEYMVHKLSHNGSQKNDFFPLSKSASVAAKSYYSVHYVHMLRTMRFVLNENVLSIHDDPAANFTMTNGSEPSMYAHSISQYDLHVLNEY